MWFMLRTPAVAVQAPTPISPASQQHTWADTLRRPKRCKDAIDAGLALFGQQQYQVGGRLHPGFPSCAPGSLPAWSGITQDAARTDAG
jgi:hypothetical protein